MINKINKSKNGFKTYGRMLKFAKPYIHWFVLSAIASLLIVFADALSLWITGTLMGSIFNNSTKVIAKPEFSISHINDILKYITYVAIGSGSKARSLQIACAVLFGSILFKNTLLYIKSLMVTFLNLQIIKDIRDKLYRHVISLPVSYFDVNKSGNVVSLLVNDIAMINTSLTNSINNLLVDPIRIISFVVLLFIISPTMTLVLFIVYPVMGYLITTIGKTVRRRTTRVLNNFSGLLSVLNETVTGVRAVKMFNMTHVESEKFAYENEKYSKSFFRNARISNISSPLTETLGYLVTVMLVWFVGGRSLAGPGFSGEDFFHYVIILFSSYQPLKRLSKVNMSLQGGIAAAERVFDLLDTKPEELSLPDPNNSIKFQKEIVYDKVTFSYPECTEEVLSNVSFTLSKGSIVAIVGSSGSGKSTLLDLLPRFYEVSLGSIKIDGKDIRQYDLTALRQLFGIVSQETILFNDTIANNISYGVKSANIEQIRNSANAANALEFIDKLPDGMDTIIGEKGVTLSGGQRQRLAIARALLRNPPILILDEATSSLDTESERLVQNAINVLMENRTVLVVAHRLSTILHADKILVMEKGRIIEQGNHSELISSGKRYKQLYDIQFQTKKSKST